MRAAVIDIGSNTIRLLIFSTTNKEGFKRLKTLRIVTGLAKGLVKTYKLNPQGKIKTLRGLQRFIELCQKQEAAQIYAIGTSALREAKDAEEFVKTIENTTGLVTEIITGQREAELTYAGIACSLEFAEPTLFVDIGGGSTEWFLKDGFHKNHASLPVGAITLSDAFITKDPPSEQEISLAIGHVKKTIINSGLSEAITRKLMNIAITGGTAAALACIDFGLKRYRGNKIHLHKITKDSFDGLSKRLQETPFHERRLIKGLDLKRARIIVTGTIVLKVFWDLCPSVDSIFYSDYGLLEGFASELFSGNSNNQALCNRCYNITH